jgi:hypothetical protein
LAFEREFIRNGGQALRGEKEQTETPHASRLGRDGGRSREARVICLPACDQTL